MAEHDEVAPTDYKGDLLGQKQGVCFLFWAGVIHGDGKAQGVKADGWNRVFFHILD